MLIFAVFLFLTVYPSAGIFPEPVVSGFAV